MDSQSANPLFDLLINKSSLKQSVYENTCKAFGMFNMAVQELVEDFKTYNDGSATNIPFEFTRKGDFELDLKFAGDILLFLMHSNVFEFSRNHEVMRTSYVREDPERSYCGVIHIYNFLSDSFKYNRINDLGYMIGRIFINKDMHYFVEGKREIGQLYNNFSTNIMNSETAAEIIRSSVKYTVNFDLLSPPYENVKEVSVYDMISTLDNITLKTGKRMGFKFQADRNNGDADEK